MKISERLKKEIQNEILSLLDENIDNNVQAMKGHYSVAEIAKEVLLSMNTIGLSKQHNKISHIVIEGHDEDEMYELFEKIQNKYSLYDNCVIETGLSPDNTIIDKDRCEETGQLYVDKKLVKRYGE